MTPRDSKFENELEHRLQQALKNKSKVYSQEIQTEALDTRVRTPIRIHQQMIQRAQFYTGDA
ncbi:MAG: hypothetical protein ACREFR_09580 [Limisphaerales bacterium]